MMHTERPKKNIYFISRHSGKHTHGTICIRHTTTAFEVHMFQQLTLHRKAGKAPPKFPRNAIGKIIWSENNTHSIAGTS